MSQHPKVTVGWAMACLERALDGLGDSGAEIRVRKQFHQLVLALERDGHTFYEAQLFLRPGSPASVIPLPLRTNNIASS